MCVGLAGWGGRDMDKGGRESEACGRGIGAETRRVGMWEVLVRKTRREE
jgi:hypothetical protein